MIDDDDDRITADDIKALERAVGHLSAMNSTIEQSSAAWRAVAKLKRNLPPRWHPPTKHCGLCDAGFDRVRGIHIPSQRLGMIKAQPCACVEAIFEFHGNDGQADPNARLWVAYVDGQPLKTARGGNRAFASEAAALKAARAASSTVR